MQENNTYITRDGKVLRIRKWFDCVACWSIWKYKEYENGDGEYFTWCSVCWYKYKDSNYLPPKELVHDNRSNNN